MVYFFIYILIVFLSLLKISIFVNYYNELKFYFGFLNIKIPIKSKIFENKFNEFKKKTFKENINEVKKTFNNSKKFKVLVNNVSLDKFVFNYYERLEDLSLTNLAFNQGLYLEMVVISSVLFKRRQNEHYFFMLSDYRHYEIDLIMSIKIYELIIVFLRMIFNFGGNKHVTS